MAKKESPFKLDIDSAKKLGNTLRLLRESNNRTFLDISKKTDIDISTLFKLEQGEILRVNFFMLKKITEYYNINPIDLLIITNIMTEKDVFNYLPKSKFNQRNIPIFSTFSNFKKNEVSFYIHSPFSFSETLKGVVFNNELFILDTSFSETNSNDTFVFDIDRLFVFSKLHILENKFFLKDIFSEENYIIQYSKNKIIGKILYSITSFADYKFEK